MPTAGLRLPCLRRLGQSDSVAEMPCLRFFERIYLDAKRYNLTVGTSLILHVWECEYLTAHRRRASVVAPCSLETWALFAEALEAQKRARKVLTQSRELLKRMQVGSARGQLWFRESGKA